MAFVLLAGMVFRLEVLSQSEHRSDLQNARLRGCWPEWYSGLRSSPSRNIIPTYKARRMWGCWPEWYSGLRPSQSEYHSDLQSPQNVELLAGMVFRLEVNCIDYSSMSPT